MTGPNSSQFVKNYGFFVSTKAYNNQPTVQCTTCHNQHLMNVVKVTNGPNSGLPSGNYATMFFIRAPVQPGKRNRWFEPDGAVLPSVPWWRSQRNEWRNLYPDHLLILIVFDWGESRSLPSF